MGLFDPAREPRRRGGSLMMGALIAVVALIMYFSQTEKNPITGESQRVSMSPSQEIQLGLRSAPAMAAKMGGELPASDPRTQKVQAIGNRVLKQSQAHKGPWKFEFHLLNDSKTINAFALPGGQIFITQGLYNELKTDSQLAGVLAHEMGHVIQRHSAQQMAKGQLGQLLVTAVGVGASDGSNQGYQAAMIANVVNQMMQLRYGRSDELEADQWGLRLMSESGYSPEAMIQVMEILKKASPGGHVPEMLLTHPYPESRIEKIKEYLKQHPTKN